VSAVTFGGGAGDGEQSLFRKEVRIVADEVTNSLITLATRRDYDKVLEVLRKIDVVPRQVVLEVMIAEIVLTNDLDFGVAWALADGRLRNAGDAGGGGAEGAPNILNNRAPAGPGNVVHSLGGLLADATRFPSSGAFAVVTDRNNVNVFLNALQGRTNVKMLSAPHIIAADNREAHILVGQSIPILTSTQQSTIATANIVQSVQYRDTGKILTILPQVNSKGLVNLQVRQEVSAVLSQSFGATNSPSFSTREAETTMVVQDGDTVIIGGIIDDQISEGRSGIPYLMDVPFLGRAFRSENRQVTRTELLVTITPYVIRTRDEAVQVTGDFSDRIRGVTRLREVMHGERLRRWAESADERASGIESDVPEGSAAPADVP